MRETTKEIEIDGQLYQIGLMDAMTGSWIAMQIATKFFPMGIESMMHLSQDSLPANRSELTEAEFRNIQLHCLKVVSRVETVGTQSTPMPLLMGNGQWAIKELSTDAVTILTLTAHALVFNIKPFFELGALKRVLDSLLGLMPSDAPTT